MNRNVVIALASALVLTSGSAAFGQSASQIGTAPSAHTEELSLLEKAERILVDGAAGADVTEGLRLLQLAADAGQVRALARLGDIYRQGQFDLPADPVKAVSYYRRLADTGNVGALVRLGDLYRSGLPEAQRDRAVAAAFYEQAIGKGADGARKNLARLLLSPGGTDADIHQAVGLLEEASSAGDAGSALALANLYRKGSGVAVDGEKAVNLLEPLVQENQVSAINALGDLYRAGAGNVAKDPAKAYALFKRSAGMGNRGAQKRLADMLIRGEGVDADFDAGAAMLAAFADKGDVGAMLQLGDYYSLPEFGKNASAVAITYYRQAADAGNSSALTRLGDLYRNGASGLPADAAQAAVFYEQAIAKGDNTARRTFATMLLSGQGTAADPQRALALLEAAAAAGDPRAAQQLGAAWSNGAAFKVDYARSAAAYQRAAEGGLPQAKVQFAMALATGPLSRQHKNEGVSLLRAAADSDLPNARLQLARLQVSGNIPKASVADALKTLQPAVERNDSAAIRYLVGLYRDGYRKDLRPNFSAAAALIDAKADILGLEAVAYERVLLAAAATPWSQALAARIDTEMAVLDSDDSGSVLKRMRRANPNGYVYLLQERLRLLDYYSGSSSGLLTAATISALRDFCVTEGIAAACAKGPLSVTAANAIAGVIFARQTNA